MRTMPILLLLLFVSACSRSFQPVAFTGPTAAPAPLECARAEMEDLGYDVMAADPGSDGSVTGTRVNERSWLLRIIGFRDTADQITATVSGGELHVTALSSDPDDPSEGGPSLRGQGANREAERDARQVFGACAESA